MKSWWADTLFKRLFVLMWAALVVSHLCAYLVVHRLNAAPGAPARGITDLPVLPSLPPGNLLSGEERGGPPPGSGGPRSGPRPGGPPADSFAGSPPSPPGGALPQDALWLDYLVRFLVIGAAAWFGARWLSSPMRRLAAASQALGPALQKHQAPARLDEQRGTLEVRQTAQVFNAMSLQLLEQFKAQGLLMAAISHDLRTPLARLRLRLEQMGSHPQAPACIADVQEMDGLIGSVLDLMRDEHSPAALQRVDVLALAQALADDLAAQGLPVSVNSQSGQKVQSAVVLAQPAALTRVLSNLIGNALRHAGSAEVSVSTLQGRVHVMVDDEGPGIPAAELETVFQPFYRLESTRHPASAAGSGLGLHIARDLTERHGGQLTLSNRSTGGLRAELVLPLA